MPRIVDDAALAGGSVREAKAPNCRAKSFAEAFFLCPFELFVGDRGGVTIVGAWFWTIHFALKPVRGGEEMGPGGRSVIAEAGGDWGRERRAVSGW